MLRYILFDLDDTLYPTSAGLMDEISQRMNEFMITRLDVPAHDVARQRKDYWERYGTTLRGLYIERHIDPQAFLNFVHDVAITKYLGADARLDQMLAQIAQTKSVFTNAPGDYARRVLDALGVAHHFEKIFDINFIEYQSKPNAFAYDKVLSALPVRANECVMIDDTPRNLAPAQKLGMKTILLNRENHRTLPSGVDAIAQTIYDVAQVVQDLD
ncbi:MAG: pyrimidine 5'-nucleotidase [Chloroflexi bacterium]|nr:pyrimidine 5'-nucleotidase [Chloroflexota bacterium]